MTDEERDEQARWDAEICAHDDDNSSEELVIKYTPEYIKTVTGLNEAQCKRVLYWLGEMYDETKGISISAIHKIAEGVRAELL